MGVCKRIVSLQWWFMWVIPKGDHKTPWVKWSVVCKPKSEGGLGLYDIWLVNLALPEKWRWHLIFGREALWGDIITTFYGGGSLFNHHGGCPLDLWSTSCWWIDVSLLESAFNEQREWFSSDISKNVSRVTYAPLE